MKIKAQADEIITPNATVEFTTGDTLSVAFKTNGVFRVVNITMRGGALVVADEQNGDTLVVRERSSQYVMG